MCEYAQYRQKYCFKSCLRQSCILIGYFCCQLSNGRVFFALCGKRFVWSFDSSLVPVKIFSLWETRVCRISSLLKREQNWPLPTRISRGLEKRAEKKNPFLGFLTPIRHQLGAGGGRGGKDSSREKNMKSPTLLLKIVTTHKSFFLGGGAKHDCDWIALFINFE